MSDLNPWEKLQYRLILAVSRRLESGGAPVLRRLAERIGALLWLLIPSRRKLAITTMMERLQLSEEAATLLARKSFTHNALSFLEITLAPDFDFSRSDLRIEKPELLAELRTCNRPLLFTTGHLGAWELNAGLAGAFLPPPLPRTLVVRSHGNKVVRQYIFSMRGRRGGQVIGHRNAAFSILKTLRRNGLVGLLVDHNAGSSEAIFLPFLGKLAAVNSGPAVLAVRTEALICPTVVVREEHGYALLSGDILDTATLPGNHEERIHAAAAFYTAAIEKWVREYPEQWFWMHKRWKTRPPDEAC